MIQFYDQNSMGMQITAQVPGANTQVNMPKYLPPSRTQQ